MKALLKKLLPRRLVKAMLGPYHLARAVLANLINGFPARKLQVIAVTGTNGKTTSANFMASVLQAAGYKVGVSTTANFRIGDEAWDNELNMTTTNPFALQKLLRRMKLAKLDWVILEVTSHALAQHRTWGIPIHTAVMTNLSPDHLDYHGSVEEYAATKAKLFKKAREVVVLNHDDEWYGYFRGSSDVRAAYTYGTHEQADVRLVRAQLQSACSRVRFRYGERSIDCELHLPGKFNVYNALSAATVAFGIDIEWQDVKAGLEALPGVPGRMERIEAGQDFTVLVDYAHTPDAFENIFHSLRPLTKGRIIAVFGGAPMHDYRGLGEAASKLADVLVITDDEPLEADPDMIRTEIIEAASKARSIRHSEQGEESRSFAAAQDDSEWLYDIADRREGIKQAFGLAGPGDVVALLCLGHQKYRRVGGTRIEWDDRAVAWELLTVQ